jgi:hypothetical protein
MFIKTRGKADKVTNTMCKEAARWYGRRLLGEKLYQNIELILDFKDEDISNDLLGFCFYHIDDISMRKFTISLSPKLSKKNILTALAHEMVHLKQYARGELKDFVRAKGVKWKGKIYDEEKLDYWDHPWEIEAYGRERGLYIRYMQFQKQKIAIDK